MMRIEELDDNINPRKKLLLYLTASVRGCGRVVFGGYFLPLALDIKQSILPNFTNFRNLESL
jgi:hypothetical protein